MPTFLDNSLGYLNNGWQQMYGQPAVGVSPATPVSQPPQAVGTPVMVSPTVTGSPDMPQMVPLLQLLGGGNPNPGPTPIAYNPEIGQIAPDASAGTPGLLSGGNNFNILSFLQNLFGGGGQQSSPGQPASISAPAQNPLTQVGPPTPTTPQAPQTTGGVATDSPAIDAANAGNTSFGGGGGGPNIGGGILSGIGSGLSQMGKSTASAQTTFTPVNLPLPQRAYFLPPNLSPNTQRGY